MRLLLAEDEKVLSDALVTILTHNHYSVDAVYNGQDALDYLENGTYDGAILDIMMPRLDGYQTCALIKNNQTFKSVPVIMLSSKDGLFDKARGRIVGSEQYLTKPFTREELLGAIRKYVNA